MSNSTPTQNSFSAWLKETEKNGGDPFTQANNNNNNNKNDSIFGGFLKTWTQSDVGKQADELEAGGLLSRTTIIDDGSSSSSNEFALSRTEKFKWFMTLVGLGVFFFILSLFFLGVVLMFPGKFAFSFTLGSLSIMSAFILVQGFSAWTAEVCRRERLPFTFSYFGSIFGTLFATLYLRNYILIIGFSCLQISSLGWYFATYVPGGKHGMAMISSVVKGTCKTCCKGCRMCIGV